MFSNRTLASLKRVVTTLSPDFRRYLFERAGLALIDERNPETGELQVEELNQRDARELVEMVEDLATRRVYYRSSVAPRYLFDTPYDDFQRFLPLDGYGFRNGHLVREENVIVDFSRKKIG